MYKEPLFFLCLQILLVADTFGGILYEPLPGYMYDCYDKHVKSSSFAKMPAERIAETCLSNYGWSITGVKCSNMSRPDLDYIGGLIAPYLHGSHTRGKRQAGLRVRKEIRMMSDSERQTFFDTVNVLKRNGNYDRIARYHDESVRTTAHGGASFLPWHRLYIYILENALREINPSVTLPYWNSNLDNNMPTGQRSIMWSDDFVGGIRSVTSGPFSFWGILRDVGSDGRLITDDELTSLHGQTNSRRFGEVLESLHDAVHVYVGGDMSILTTAPRDVVFFLHHCYIDYLWWQWQSQNQNQNFPWQYPPGPHEQGHAPNYAMTSLERPELTNRVLFSREWAFNYFTYERSPTSCESLCTGPYYRCYEIEGRWTWSWFRGWELQPGSRRCGSVAAGANGPSRRKRDLFHNMHMHFMDPEKAFNIPMATVTKHFHPNQQMSKTTSAFALTTQNTFVINCLADFSLWVYLPIKIIRLRPPGMMYQSFLVANGKMDDHFDLYSDIMLRKTTSYTKAENPICFKDCDEDKSGVSKVTVRSDGLNYYGTYNDYVIMDARQPIDSKVTYIAVRRPDKRNTKVVLTAHDHCGRICTPKCLVKGSKPPRYVPCSGALTIDSKKPCPYGNSYGDAVMKYWSMDVGSRPSPNESSVAIVFYCDYKAKWFPWPGVKKSKTHAVADKEYYF